MRASQHQRAAIFERREVTQGTTYGEDIVTWTPIAVDDAGDPIAFMVEMQDVLPSRSEALRQGVATARNQTRVRMRWRGDITSDLRMKVAIPFGQIPWGSPQWWTDNFTLYQIIGGPAEIEGRRSRIEFMAEKYSTEAA